MSFLRNLHNVYNCASSGYGPHLFDDVDNVHLHLFLPQVEHLDQTFKGGQVAGAQLSVVRHAPLQLALQCARVTVFVLSMRLRLVQGLKSGIA